MDWSNFTFGSATGLSVVKEPGQPDPHWYRQREVDMQHCKGSNRTIITDLGLGVEKLSCTIYLEGEGNYNAFTNAGRNTLDGRSVLAMITGAPETYFDDTKLYAYIPVDFITT
jgi:hypothetical protein